MEATKRERTHFVTHQNSGAEPMTGPPQPLEQGKPARQSRRAFCLYGRQNVPESDPPHRRSPGDTYIWTVSKGSIEGLLGWGKQILDVI